MRALTRGERQASVGVAAGLLGVFCLLVASLGLNIKHAADLQDVKHTIYLRCLARASYDAASNQARLVEVREWRALAAQERTNPHIDDRLRAERVGAYTRLADGMQDAVDAQVRGSCEAYR